MSAAIRVLYAEDNALDADLTRAYLAEHAPDLALEVVESGGACLARLRAKEHDLLLLDHWLTDMEGLDVLRALVRFPVPVPVVLISGAGDEELVVKALRLGASNYVPKTGDYLTSLPALLREVVEEHRSRLARGLLPTAPRRILYVEHQEMDIELTSRHFAEVVPPVELDVVRSFPAALARLGTPPPYDAALIDLRMPGQSALEFVRESPAPRRRDAAVRRPDGQGGRGDRDRQPEARGRRLRHQARGLPRPAHLRARAGRRARSRGPARRAAAGRAAGARADRGRARAARDPAPPGAAARGHRAARRRRGARLQQPALGDPELHGLRPRGDAGGRPGQERPARGEEGRRSRRGADAASCSRSAASRCCSPCRST